MKEVSLLKSYLHPLGRTIYHTKNGRSGLYFAHSNSGFALRVLAKENFHMRLNFDSEVNLENQSQYMVLYMDRHFYQKYALENGDVTLNLDLSSFKGEHTLELIKVNEPQHAKLHLLSLEVENGEILPFLTPHTKKMEFYGASTTSGFGILGKKEDPFTLKTEDSSLSFSYQVPYQLGYETSVISYSGMSMALKFHQPFTLLDVYDKIDGTIPWDFSNYHPDYIVIDIGTNDNENLKHIEEEKQEEASELYYQNLHCLAFQLLKEHPSATLIFIHSMMVAISPYLIHQMERVKDEVINEAQNQAFVLSFEPNQEGACHHPSKVAHQKITSQIIDLIRKLEK